MNNVEDIRKKRNGATKKAASPPVGTEFTIDGEERAALEALRSAIADAKVEAYDSMMAHLRALNTGKINPLEAAYMKQATTLLEKRDIHVAAEESWSLDLAEGVFRRTK